MGKLVVAYKDKPVYKKLLSVLNCFLATSTVLVVGLFLRYAAAYMFFVLGLCSLSHAIISWKNSKILRIVYLVAAVIAVVLSVYLYVSEASAEAIQNSQ